MRAVFVAVAFRLALQSLEVVADITWNHFSANVNCDPELYSNEDSFAADLFKAWNLVTTDSSLAVYMLRTKDSATPERKIEIEGDFEIQLKEFIPPDLHLFLAPKATAAQLRSQKADYDVDAVEAVPASVKVLKELRQAQKFAKTSKEEQSEVIIELSPGSKANERQSQDLASYWEGAIHGAQKGSKAKFTSKATDIISLTGVKGDEMGLALSIVSSQPEALVLEFAPNYTEIEPVPIGEPIVVGARRLKRRLNNEADDITQSGVLGQSPLKDAGLLGQGEVVGIADSGLYDQSCYFNNNDNLPRNSEPDPSQRKVIQYIAYADGIAGEARDHGTHVAGSVAGSSTLEGGQIYNGMAPEAKIHFFDIGFAGSPRLRVPGNLATGLFPFAKEAGAAIHTNSWGSSINRYTTSSRDVDAYSYENEDFVILIAAGNSGSQGNTVGSPATSKNCIAVGASINAKEGNIEDLATFSSRGPTADGRIKPDIIAPGHSVLSAASEQICSVVRMSGTSMATPILAGSLALIRQYFREGWYPSGAKNANDAFTPSGALLKAMLIHSGKQMIGQGVGVFPGFDQGFGRADLDSVLKLGSNNSERGTLYVRGTKVGGSSEDRSELPNGARFERQFKMTSSGKIKATLVWMDPPSAINANKNLVNDLDLVVVCAGSTSYPNGGNVADRTNNVEMIESNVTAGAICSVTVVATLIRQGVLQPYALVVNGPFDADDIDSPSATTATTVPPYSPIPSMSRFVKINSQSCGQQCTCEALQMSPIRDRETCQQAAVELGLRDATATEIRGTPRPDGCYYVTNRLYLAFNPLNAGNGVQGGREPLCKPKAVYYARIASGSCAERGMVPITSVEQCEYAALELGLVDASAYPVRSINRPEGCYYKDAVPGFSLFLATHKENVGKGAMDSRDQICKRPDSAALSMPYTGKANSLDIGTLSSSPPQAPLAAACALFVVGMFVFRY